jgi:hypothetical protein
MGAAAVPVVMVLVLLAVVMAGLAVLGRRQDRDLARAGATPGALAYRVPEGQDPAAVVTALRGEGLEAVADGDVVRVGGPGQGEPDREHVRRVLAVAPLNSEGDPAWTRDVRFLDER